MSVEVRGLAKRFSSTGSPAVDGVSFTAPKGEITTLLGPSGSGKTTVLRLLAGLESPDRGAILVDGVDWARMPVRQRGVGLVFQSYALFQQMLVRDNVAFGLRARGVGRREADARVDELLELVQLSEVADRYPAQLSGGQQQRVALARALAPRPALLLLDEPFGALDAHVRVELRRWLSRLHQQTQVTTLLVTHDQEEALEISHQLVVMHEGRVSQSGTPGEVYDHPATPFVAAFVGSANRLRGRVEGGRAALGALSVDAPGGMEGASVEAFVRPHDVRLSKMDDTVGAVLALDTAKIVHHNRVGGVVKVELELASGEQLIVQMPVAEADALGLRTGDSVVVDLRNAKLFVEPDYSI